MKGMIKTTIYITDEMEKALGRKGRKLATITEKGREALA